MECRLFAFPEGRTKSKRMKGHEFEFLTGIGGMALQWSRFFVMNLTSN